VEKIPFRAITEMLDALRQIVTLERELVESTLRESVQKQGSRVALLGVSGFFVALAIQLLAFWVGVALYQGGFSIGMVLLFSVLSCPVLAGFSWIFARRVKGRSSSRTHQEPVYERQGSSERDRFSKEAA